MKRNIAFSLLELLVVIAIIGVLAAIAIPSYKSYIIRSKITNAFSVLNGFKSQAEVYYSQHGVWPSGIDLGYATGGSAALVDPSSYVKDAVGVYIDGNSNREHLTVHYDLNLGTPENLAISLYGLEENGVIKWICGIHPWSSFAGNSSIQYMPSGCQQRNPNL